MARRRTENNKNYPRKAPKKWNHENIIGRSAAGRPAAARPAAGRPAAGRPAAGRPAATSSWSTKLGPNGEQTGTKLGPNWGPKRDQDETKLGPSSGPAPVRHRGPKKCLKCVTVIKNRLRHRLLAPGGTRFGDPLGDSLKYPIRTL